MVDKDQQMRFSGIWNPKIDQKNTNDLKKILNKHGWPDIKLVGKKASLGAFLLAQHADRDLNFQKLCLKLIAEKLKERQVVPSCFAYLADRVLVNSKQKQIYGTQFYFDKKNNKFAPQPIKDRKNLFKRRRQMKLGSFWADFKLLKKRQQEFSSKRK